MFLGKNKMMKVLNPGDHGSTFGGNPLASAVAYTSLCILDDDNMAEQSFISGEFFKNELKNLNSLYIKEVRGKGLFIAIEIFPEYFEEFYKQLLGFKVLSVKTRNNAIRFLPPLNIDKDVILAAISKIKMIKI
jgi:ornithine--oxo-acid transaminase